MQFLQNGWGDLGAGIASIILIAGGFLLQTRRLSHKRREQDDPSISQPVSEVRSAQDMLLRVIDRWPHNQWLQWVSGIRYRVTPFEEDWLIERVELAAWPPKPSSTLRVESIVVQPGRDYAPRFSVDVQVTERGHVPPSLKTTSTKLMVNGAQRNQTPAEASEIIEWMQALDEVRQE